MGWTKSLWSNLRWAVIAKIKCLVWNHDQKIVAALFSSLKKKSTGAIYQEMLEQFFIPQLQGISNIIFQLGSATLHWSLDVQDCLDEYFPEHWIWWDGRFNEMTSSCDFFSWGFMKHKVYHTKIKIHSLNELKEKNKGGISTTVTRHVGEKLGWISIIVLISSGNLIETI